jgi:hypothetical protein
MPLKTEATKFAKEDGHGSVSPQRLLAGYVRVNKGARELAREGGGAQAARITGQSLGTFLARVGQVGLDETLRETGLADLIGRSAADLATGLLNALAAPGSTLDDHAARLALAKLNEEIFEAAETYEDAERALAAAIDQQGLVWLLTNYFGKYLYERFCRDFYETWVKKVGASQAGRSLKSIKDCITSSLKAKLTRRDLSGFNWRGAEGSKLTEQVMQETLEIFEV